MRLPKGSPLRSEMRKGLDWLGRIRSASSGQVKGKKLENVCQSLGFSLRLWKVAAEAEKAPDPVSSLVRWSLNKFRLLNLCRPCGEHVETTITHRLRASGFHSFLIIRSPARLKRSVNFVRVQRFVRKFKKKFLHDSCLNHTQ